MKDSPYFRQAQLMLRVMPQVAAEACFNAIALAQLRVDNAFLEPDEGQPGQVIAT